MFEQFLINSLTLLCYKTICIFYNFNIQINLFSGLTIFSKSQAKRILKVLFHRDAVLQPEIREHLLLPFQKNQSDQIIPVYAGALYLILTAQCCLKNGVLLSCTSFT